MIVLAARAAGIAVFDGVFNRPRRCRRLPARRRRRADGLGFDGKSLIHPDQIEPCHRAFAPCEAEVERARRLVEAFDGGAERFENEMIERMHVEAGAAGAGAGRRLTQLGESAVPCHGPIWPTSPTPPTSRWA